MQCHNISLVLALAGWLAKSLINVQLFVQQPALRYNGMETITFASYGGNGAATTDSNPFGSHLQQRF